MPHGNTRIATHDPAMIDATQASVRRKAYTSGRFEFQVLYGIRRNLQLRLVKEGYRVPANVAFVLRGIFSDTTSSWPRVVFPACREVI